MQQSRKVSLIEATMNTLIGFVVAYVAWPPAAAVFDIPYSHGQHFGIVLFFTVLSVIRSYAVRRWFNARLHKAALTLAGE